MTTKKRDAEADAEVHKQALARFDVMEQHWSETYKQISDDIDFMLNADNAQWKDGREYEPDKVKIVINKCEAEVDAIVNEMRATRPAIDYSPVDDGADVDTAEVLDGLARNTEQLSGASTAYDTAALPQVAGGLGFWRINLKYVPGTFNQEPRIDAVHDFRTILIDNLSVELDGHDMNDAFAIENDTRIEDFKRQYPKANTSDFRKDLPGWFKDDKTIRTAEYFYKETSYEEIHQVSMNGELDVLREKDREELEQKIGYELGELKSEDPNDGVIRIVRSRKDEIPLVKWCKLNGHEILEKTEFISQYIPIIPVYGKMVINNGKRRVSGLIKVLRGPQMLLNYWESSHSEIIALQPKAPLMAYEGTFEPYGDIYKNANRKNYPVLPVVPIVKQGILLPPPTRQPPPEPSLAMVQQTQAALQHFKSVTGKVYDEGQKTLGSESGKAILAKTQKGEVASYHFIDNQAKSIRHTGIILGEIYPKVYSGPQIKRILGEDGSQQNVKINQPISEPAFKPKGDKFKGIYDLDAGKYDVTVNVGPSYASRRQESVQSMLELAAVIPQVMSSCADLIAKNSDWPGAQEIAERLRKMLPPGLADDKQSPEQVALMQAQQVVELLKGKIAEMDKALADKTRSEDQKHKIDLINAGLKQEEINIKKFEASITAMQAQAAANERMQPQDFAKIIQFITEMDTRVQDAHTAIELLLSADEGDPSQPVQTGDAPTP